MWTDGHPFPDKRRTTAGTILTVVSGFTPTEVDPGITMTTEGATMEITLIFLMNAEADHHPEG